MRFLLIALFCINFIFFSKIYPNTILTLEESAVLSTFFRTLTEEAEMGYVLFDQKPVCIAGYYTKENLCPHYHWHNKSVPLKEGARIWKQYENYSCHKKIFIHICSYEEPFITGYKHILIINIPLFHKVVNENLPLFQQELGPSITSQKLLNALIVNDTPLHYLLNMNTVLVGILLGFGTQNSLYESRAETLQEALIKIFPPFLKGELWSMQLMGEYLPFKPSLGYQSIQAEYLDLRKKIATSSYKLTHEKPFYIFGRVKLPSEEKMINDLDGAQDRIKELLASPTFLEQILDKITGWEFQVANNAYAPFRFQFSSSDSNKIIAEGIWQALKNYDMTCIEAFIDGIDGLRPGISKLDPKAWASDYRQEMIMGKKNLTEADQLFQILNEDKQYACISPHKVYYRILKKGNEASGHLNTNQPFVNLSYCIFSPEDHCLASQSDILINLKNTIPGFQLGIKGMCVGETREFWVHPSLTYDVDSLFEKCIYLRMIVTLNSIYQDGTKNKEKSISSENLIDLSFFRNPMMEENITDVYKSVLIEKGSRLRRFIEKDKNFDLSQIVQKLKQFNSGENNIMTLEEDLLNQILWNIYFSPDACF